MEKGTNKPEMLVPDREGIYRPVSEALQTNSASSSDGNQLVEVPRYGVPAVIENAVSKNTLAVFLAKHRKYLSESLITEITETLADTETTVERIASLQKQILETTLNKING